MRELAITYLSSERFASSPQEGIIIRQDFRGLVRHCLAWPRVGTDKREAGALCMAALEGGRVKNGRGPVALLAADVDECSEGAIERSAEALRLFSGVIVPTFSATCAEPRHRVFLEPSRDLSPDEHPLAWRKMDRDLAAVGIALDRTCRNLNRLFFLPVTPSLERWAELGGARLLTGGPVDVDAMLEAARDEERELEEARRAAARTHVGPIKHPDRYVAGALGRARRTVAGASPGGRHDALLREAFSLARLDLTDDQIADALLPAFVAAAGKARRREGERAIADAVAAGRQGAA